MEFGFKNILGAEPPKNSKAERRIKKNNEPENSGRRLFLKTGASMAAAALMTSMPPLTIKALESLGYLEESEIPEKEPTKEQQEIVDSDNDATLDVEEDILANVRSEIQKDERLRLERDDKEKIDNRPLEERLSYSNNQIFLDGEKIQERLKNKWLAYYGEGGKGHNDLVDAYSKMQLYIEELKNIFRKEGVPEEYAYLAIPESHFNPDALSPALALGAYQFMIVTAEEVGLAKTERNKNGKIVKIIYDYRRDVIKSATACAKYLRKKYNQCGDWRLAVAAYNGFVGRFFLAEDSYEARNYQAFVEFIEDDLNEKKEKVQGDFYDYQVNAGDSIPEIALFFEIDPAVLKKDNGIPSGNNDIRAGDKIRVRLSNMDQRMAIFEKIANPKGLAENFNYPAKFEAVWELIQKAESVKIGKNPLINEKAVLQAKLDREREKYYTYTIKGGDNLYRIAGNHVKKNGLKISANEMVGIIKKKNNLTSDTVKSGQKIKIPMRV